MSLASASVFALSAFDSDELGNYYLDQRKLIESAVKAAKVSGDVFCWLSDKPRTTARRVPFMFG